MSQGRAPPGESNRALHRRHAARKRSNIELARAVDYVKSSSGRESHVAAAADSGDCRAGSPDAGCLINCVENSGVGHVIECSARRKRHAKRGRNSCTQRAGQRDRRNARRRRVVSINLAIGRIDGVEEHAVARALSDRGRAAARVTREERRHRARGGIDMIDAKIGGPANLINVVRLGRRRLRHEQDKCETQEHPAFRPSPQRLHRSQAGFQFVDCASHLSFTVYER